MAGPDNTRGLDIQLGFQTTTISSNVQWFLSSNFAGAGPTYPRFAVPRQCNRQKLWLHCVTIDLSGGIGGPLLSFGLYKNGSVVVTNWMQLANGASGVQQSSIQSFSFVEGDDVAIFMRGPGNSFTMPLSFAGYLTLDLIR